MNERMKKRIAAFSLSLTVAVLGFAAPAAFAQTAGSTAESSAAATLSAIGVLSGDGSGNYNLTQQVTRAQLARMIVDCSDYKNLVTNGVSSSLYKDVDRNHWAAAYIKVAVEKGLMSGYSDGTFRPDEGVTYEQAVNSVLKLLGYTDEDFKGAFPYAQVNTAETLGITDGVGKSIGMTVSKGDVASLLYNALNTYVKDSTTTKYAQQLGYTLNESGVIDYASAISENMTGPVTVTASSWYKDLGLGDSVVIYKKGNLAALSDVSINDIIYYSKSMNTAWVYDDRVYGIYEKAEPNQDAPTSVVVSGTTYQIEGSQAFSALSSGGELKIGDTITLLLGKDGKVADAVSLSASNSGGDSITLYVIDTGEKTYTDATGASNTSHYIKGVSAAGGIYEYAVDAAWMDVGDVVTLEFGTSSDGTIKVKNPSSKVGITGVVSAEYQILGQMKLSENVSIIDTEGGSYTRTSLSRLDGISLGSRDVLYSKGENGVITEMILNDVTGDCAKYGIVTSAKNNSGGMNLSGSYSFLVDGVKESVNTQSLSYNASVGPASFHYDNGVLSSIKNLDGISGRATEITDTYAVIGNKTYPYAASVSVYRYDSSDRTYQASTLAQMKKSSRVTFYSDDDPENGGRIRIIVYQS